MFLLRLTLDYCWRLLRKDAPWGSSFMNAIYCLICCVYLCVPVYFRRERQRNGIFLFQNKDPAVFLLFQDVIWSVHRWEAIIFVAACRYSGGFISWFKTLKSDYESGFKAAGSQWKCWQLTTGVATPKHLLVRIILEYSAAKGTILVD